MIASEILEYYGDGNEEQRLTASVGRLERIRTWEITHLRDRVAALAEARRVLVPGGPVFSAYISRFASACDGIREGALRDATFAAIVEHDLTNGIHQNLTTRADWFTAAYFRRPDEIRFERRQASCSTILSLSKGPVG